jgi:cytochrome c biogenesis protein CcdA
MGETCARCGVEAEDGTQKCPECDYRPQKSMQLTGSIIFVVGFVLSFVLVGIPVAIFGAYRVFKGANLTIESEYAL